MKLPHVAHTARPWRIHGIAYDFKLDDVWALPTPGGPDDFPELVKQFALGSESYTNSRIGRTLFAIRRNLGDTFGLDKQDSRSTNSLMSLRNRLPQELRHGAVGPEFRTLPFNPLYLTSNEWAVEITNRTVHAVLHIGWVSDGDKGYRGQMAVLVKPRGFVGKTYMALIAPFSHLLVYPAMIQSIEQHWRRNVLSVTGKV